MSELGRKQERFAVMLADLIHYATGLGYKVRLRELQRPAILAYIYHLMGKGSKNSCHIHSLAIDLYLFRDGTWLKDTHDYADLGEFWESNGGSWGGRFGDPGHFSIEHAGVR
jgi:hypothetical protein